MWLRVRTGPDAGTDVHLPDDGPLVLGRLAGSGLLVRDPQASRRHVELVPLGDGTWRATDLGSSNGTTLDGAPMTEALLRGGEELRIGDVIIETSRADPSAPAPEPVAELATPSMVQRIVSGATRRTRRTALGVGGVLAAAVAALAVVTLTRGEADAKLPATIAHARGWVMPITIHGAGGRTGLGTGWRAAGFGTVTAAHVVNSGPSLSTPGGAAHVRAVAPCEDLALLDTRDGGRSAQLAGGAPEAGQAVVALGFQPGGDQSVANRGVISATGVGLAQPDPDVPAYRGVLQTDTALNPGLSGGPLIDLDGHVAGVDVATRATSDDGRTLQGVNYAVPAARARAVLTQLRAGRSPSWTGFTFAYPTDAELRDAGLPAGLRITGAVPGTPAARSGLAPGTLVAGVDGQPIANTLASLCSRLQGRVTGDEVVLNVAVPGRTRTRQVPLKLA